ncbi:hypothetical protein [Amycolatopsis sp.]|uniref:hypothetical protein n=1 Tax=Amycolatopsis sp. TaxID=37632 RepID=UPI002629FBE5|nr:hypothetical protein [Amycolatopsis sp.]
MTVGQTPELPTDELWIATVDGTARPRKLTTGSAPRWTSDSAWIYFLSDRLDNGTSQLQRIRPVGGDVEALTA